MKKAIYQGKVESECARQIERWGNSEKDDLIWLGILAEEFGEVVKAVMQSDVDATAEELIQVAAVIQNWLTGHEM